jgi:hypothetical protein
MLVIYVFQNIVPLFYLVSVSVEILENLLLLFEANFVRALLRARARTLYRFGLDNYILRIHVAQTSVS